MLLASAIAVVDGLTSDHLVFIGLLAIPPVIAAMSASRPETAVVAGFCLVLGLLSVLWSQGIDGGQRLVSLTTVSAGAVVGLWVAGLRLKLNREQAASELLADAGALMEDALDQRERAQHLADLTVHGLGDVAMVDMVLADGSIQRMAAKGRDTELADLFVKLRTDSPIDPHGPHPVAEVIRTGRTLYLDQLSDKEIDRITTRENEREMLRRHRFKSCIVLPLGARGSVLGALTLWIVRPAKAFDETSRRTAKRLADRAALALDNARLHEQQSHIASVLQHSLLPRSLPEIGGFEASSRFLAAGEAYEVGGDFYDVFRSGSGSWTAVIGDVCGKGPEAASLTALARYTVRTASSPDSAPSEVLRTLHDSISSDRADLRFCTAALARIQAPSNGRGSARVTVALGGHPHPLILRKNGRVDAVGEPGTLLGALPSPVIADTEARLAVGDSLVLYTDGMLDVRDRRFGDDPDWLPRELANSAGKSADEIAEDLAGAAVKRHGGEPRDDIAVLVLNRCGG
jgi:serine phosphatase RsbU (regulator of sigma subunit)